MWDATHPAEIVCHLGVTPLAERVVRGRNIMPEPDMSVWTGRVDAADGPDALRWHQMVKPLSPDCEPGTSADRLCV